MNKITRMGSDDIANHVAAEKSAAECGCGGTCAACHAHQEFLDYLNDVERDEFAEIVASGIYDR